MRPSGRRADELRPITFERNFNDTPAGSVLVSYGRTRVLCTACIEEGVPRWLMGRGSGWVTAEYGMLPGSTGQRKAREARMGKADSRGLEISRLIGRCLRSVVNRKALKDCTIWLDCDVLQADGGTRTAAISGAYVALRDALESQRDRWKTWPLTNSIAGVSVGVVNGDVVLDLDYAEDSKADVDCNVAMNGDAKMVEIQGSAEGEPFDDAAFQEMLRLSRLGIADITRQQHLAFEQ
ncbi:MAG: ribonuclease PH [Planctomycetota bacterium]|jgi:ribonuclease PH